MSVTINLGGSWRDAASAEYVERRAGLVRQHRKATKTVSNLQRKVAGLEAQIAELDRGAKVFGLTLPENADHLVLVDPDILQDANLARGAGQGGGKQFKDVALELLAKAYPEPLRAPQVQVAAEQALGREFHWKTAGMTLYRLSKDFKVRRQGQSWFFVPVEAREALKRAAADAQLSSAPHGAFSEADDPGYEYDIEDLLGSAEPPEEAV